MFDDDDILQSGSPDDERDLAKREWASLAERFTNDGYREGITAGKEEALQAGFDEGFAATGTPVGRKLGALRGVSSALLLYLGSMLQQCETRGDPSLELARGVEEVKAIAHGLDALQLRDVVPPDREAIAHAREHDIDEDDAEAESGDAQLSAAFESLTTSDGMEKLEVLTKQLQSVLARAHVTTACLPASEA